MPHDTNPLGQPVGLAVPDWIPPPVPPREAMEGSFCRLEPVDPERHAASLHEANALDEKGALWTYLPYGPFGDLGSYRAWMRETCLGDDPLFLAVVDKKSGRARGVASYMRIDRRAGSIEVGHIQFSPPLQRSAAATEAMYLMMKRAFELGYRRYEWKCNALNGPSRAAAQRLGLSFEGVFRQAHVIKGRNRDTAWYAAIDSEWPALERAFRHWLSPENFDGQGKQVTRLSALTGPLLHRRG